MSFLGLSEREKIKRQQSVIDRDRRIQYQLNDVEKLYLANKRLALSICLNIILIIYIYTLIK